MGGPLLQMGIKTGKKLSGNCGHENYLEYTQVGCIIEFKYPITYLIIFLSNVCEYACVIVCIAYSYIWKCMYNVFYNCLPYFSEVDPIPETGAHWSPTRMATSKPQGPSCLSSPQC